MEEQSEQVYLSLTGPWESEQRTILGLRAQFPKHLTRLDMFRLCTQLKDVASLVVETPEKK